MKKSFRRSFIGYNRWDVEDYIRKMKLDYEEELSRKRDRILELNEQLRSFKEKSEQLLEQLNAYTRNEKLIATALIKAEAKAQAIEEEGYKKYLEQVDRIKNEKTKWEDHKYVLRNEIRIFEEKAAEILSKFRNDMRAIQENEYDEILESDMTVASGKEEDCPIANDCDREEDFDIIKQQYLKKEESLEELCESLGLYEENGD